MRQAKKPAGATCRGLRGTAKPLLANFVLVQFLGLCPFMGVSNKLDTAIGMSAAQLSY